MLGRIAFGVVITLVLLPSCVTAQEEASGQQETATQQEASVQAETSAQEQSIGGWAAVTTIDEIVPLWVEDQVVEWIPADTKLAMLEDQNPWVAVELPGDGKQRGWVRAKNLGMDEVKAEGESVAPPYPEDFSVVLRDLRLPDISGGTIASTSIPHSRLFIKLHLTNRKSNAVSIDQVDTWEVEGRLRTIWQKGQPGNTFNYTDELVELAEIDPQEFSPNWSLQLEAGESKEIWFQLSEEAQQRIGRVIAGGEQQGLTVRLTVASNTFDIPVGSFLKERITVTEIDRATQFSIPVIKVEGLLTGTGKFVLRERTAHLRHDPYFLLLDEANLGTSMGGSTSYGSFKTEAIVVSKHHEFWNTRFREYGRVMVPTRRVAEALIIGEKIAQLEPLAAIAADESATESERVAALTHLVPLVDKSNAADLMMDTMTSLPPELRAKIVGIIYAQASRAWAWDFIEQAAQDEDERVRAASCRCLARCDASTALEVFSRLVNDESANVKVAALYSLTVMGSDEAFSLFNETISDANSQLIIDSIRSIRTALPRPTLELLITLAMERDELSKPVVTLLGRQGRKAIENDPRVTKLIAESLLQGGAIEEIFLTSNLAPLALDDQERLISALEIPAAGESVTSDSNEVRYRPENRVSIASLLGGLRCREAVDAILKLPLDGRLEMQSLPLALGNIGDERAIAPLKQILDSLPKNNNQRLPVLLGLVMLGDEDSAIQFGKAIEEQGVVLRSLDRYIAYAPDQILAALDKAEVTNAQVLSNACYQFLSTCSRTDPERFDRVVQFSIPLTSFSSSILKQRLAHEQDLGTRYRLLKWLKGSECETMLGRFIQAYDLATYLVAQERTELGRVASADLKQVNALTIAKIVELYRLAEEDETESAKLVCESALTSLFQPLLVKEPNGPAYQVACSEELRNLPVDGVACVLKALESMVSPTVSQKGRAYGLKYVPLIERLEKLDLPTDQRINLIVYKRRLRLLLEPDNTEQCVEDAFSEALSQIPAEVIEEDEFVRICKWMNRLVVEPASCDPALAALRIDRWDHAFADRGVSDETRASQRADMTGEITANAVRRSELWRPRHEAPIIEPTKGDLNRISLGKGLITNQFVLVQAMPWAEFQQFAERVRSFGYSPLHIRPFQFKGQTNVAAIFRRDFREWGWSIERREDGVRNLNERLVERNLGVIDLVRFRDNEEEFYLVVWKEVEGTSCEHALSIGVKSSQPQRAVGPPERDLCAISYQSFRANEGAADQDSVVWRRTDPARRHITSILKGDRSRVANQSSAYIMIDLDATGIGPNGQRYYAMLRSLNQEYQSIVLWERSLEEQLQRARYLAESGYMPQAISVTEADNESGACSTICWVRPLQLHERLAKEQVQVFSLAE